MTNEFKLSDKIGKACKYIEDEKVIHLSQVKEFIKRLKSKGNYCPCDECESWREEIDKLSGGMDVGHLFL